jgi:hypothetical protein
MFFVIEVFQPVGVHIDGLELLLPIMASSSVICQDLDAPICGETGATTLKDNVAVRVGAGELARPAGMHPYVDIQFICADEVFTVFAYNCRPWTTGRPMLLYMYIQVSSTITFFLRRRIGTFRT